MKTLRNLLGSSKLFKGLILALLLVATLLKAENNSDPCSVLTLTYGIDAGTTETWNLRIYQKDGDKVSDVLYEFPGKGGYTNEALTLKVKQNVTYYVEALSIDGNDGHAIDIFYLDFLPYSCFNRAYDMALGCECDDCELDEPAGCDIYDHHFYAGEIAEGHGTIFTFTVTTYPYIDFEKACLIAGSGATAQAYLKNYSGSDVTWSLVGDKLGADINDEGVITAGSQSGTITVKATYDQGQCEVINYLYISSPCVNCGSKNVPNIPIKHEVSQGISTLTKEEQLQMLMSLGQGRTHVPNLHWDPSKSPGTRYTSGALRIPPRPTPVIDVVTTSGGLIKQSKSPLGLADVVTVAEDKYTIKFYHTNVVGARTQNEYEIAGGASPFNTITIENPDESQTNRIQVTEGPNEGETVVYMYEILTNGWEMNIDEGKQIVKRTEEWTTNTNPVRIESVQYRESTNNPVYYGTNKYEVFTFGERLIERTHGTGSDSETTAYEYYTNGLVKQVAYHDGNWRYYLYDDKGRATNIFSAHSTQGVTTNSSLCRVTIKDYSTNAVSSSGDNGSIRPLHPRKEVEKIKDQIVGLRYYVFLPGTNLSIVCLSPTADWDSSGNLITTNIFHASGIHTDKPLKTYHADGTATFYDYSGGDKSTNIVSTGKPNAQMTNITEGVRTITVTGTLGETVMNSVSNINASSDPYPIEYSTYSNYDSNARPQTVVYYNSTTNNVEYSCCGATLETNIDGTVTAHYYNALKQLTNTTQNGIQHLYLYDAAGNVTMEKRKGTNGNEVVLFTRSYDSSGRLTNEVNALNESTAFSEAFSDGLLIKTTTYPNGGTRIEKYYRDGSPESVSGTAVNPVQYLYGTHSTGTYEIRIKVGDGDETNEWAKTYFDLAGRVFKVEYASSGGATPTMEKFYNNRGQLWKQVDPDGVVTLYNYDDKGELESTGIDMNRNDTLESSIDRRTRYVTDCVTNVDNGTWYVERRRTYVWDNSGSEICVSTNEQALNGTISWTRTAAGTSRSWTVHAGDGFRYVTNTANDGRVALQTYYSHFGANFRGEYGLFPTIFAAFSRAARGLFRFREPSTSAAPPFQLLRAAFGGAPSA